MDEASRILEQLADQIVPQHDELAQLTRWARVVLAIRCARRVQALATSDWPDAPDAFPASIERTLALAEACAASGEILEELAVTAKITAAGATEAANMTSRFASFTVAFAAVNAANVVHAEGTDNAVAFVQATADSCHKSAMFAAARFPKLGGPKNPDMTRVLHQEMRRDVDTLARLAEREGWSDATPVSPQSLGDIWPKGVPAGFVRLK